MLGGVTISFDIAAGPTNFLVGTEQGVRVSLARSLARARARAISLSLSPPPPLHHRHHDAERHSQREGKGVRGANEGQLLSTERVCCLLVLGTQFSNLYALF